MSVSVQQAVEWMDVEKKCMRDRSLFCFESLFYSHMMHDLYRKPIIIDRRRIELETLNTFRNQQAGKWNGIRFLDFFLFLGKQKKSNKAVRYLLKHSIGMCSNLAFIRSEQPLTLLWVAKLLSQSPVYTVRNFTNNLKVICTSGAILGLFHEWIEVRNFGRICSTVGKGCTESNCTTFIWL